MVVEDPVDRFEVTVQTIRRDLPELADAGKLERVQGGAVYPSGVSNIGYNDQGELNEDAKAKAARYGDRMWAGPQPDHPRERTV